MAKKDKLTTNDPQNATKKTTNFTTCTQQKRGTIQVLQKWKAVPAPLVELSVIYVSNC